MAIFPASVKKGLAAVVLGATALTAVPAVVAPASANGYRVPVRGGYWSWGTSWYSVWSHYDNEWTRHGASVYGSEWVSSKCKNEWEGFAVAQSWRSWDHTNEAYYKRDC